MQTRPVHYLTTIRKIHIIRDKQTKKKKRHGKREAKEGQDKREA